VYSRMLSAFSSLMSKVAEEVEIEEDEDGEVHVVSAASWEDGQDSHLQKEGERSSSTPAAASALFQSEEGGEEERIDAAAVFDVPRNEKFESIDLLEEDDDALHLSAVDDEYEVVLEDEDDVDIEEEILEDEEEEESEEEKGGPNFLEIPSKFIDTNSYELDPHRRKSNLDVESVETTLTKLLSQRLTCSSEAELRNLDSRLEKYWEHLKCLKGSNISDPSWNFEEIQVPANLEGIPEVELVEIDKKIQRMWSKRKQKPIDLPKQTEEQEEKKHSEVSLSSRPNEEVVELHRKIEALEKTLEKSNKHLKASKRRIRDLESALNETLAKFQNSNRAEIELERMQKFQNERILYGTGIAVADLPEPEREEVSTQAQMNLMQLAIIARLREQLESRKGSGEYEGNYNNAAFEQLQNALKDTGKENGDRLEKNLKKALAFTRKKHLQEAEAVVEFLEKKHLKNLGEMQWRNHNLEQAFDLLADFVLKELASKKEEVASPEDRDRIDKSFAASVVANCIERGCPLDYVEVVAKILEFDEDQRKRVGLLKEASLWGALFGS